MNARPTSCVAPLLALLLVAACGGRTVSDAHATADAGDASSDQSAAIAFPVGSYSRCAEGMRSANGAFLNGAGFALGATLTLVQSGPTVTASYVDQNGKPSSFDFTVTTSASASLAHGGQTVPGFHGLCVLGVGVSNEQPFDAELTATSGALTYDAGTVFLSLVGSVEGDAGQCGPVATSGSFWLICDDGPSPSNASVPDALPAFPLGKYGCSSQLGTFYESGGMKQLVTSGGDGGTLELSASGSKLVASYSGDSYVSATLDFDATTPTTARAVATKQSLTAPCEVPFSSSSPPPETPQTLPVTASLALDGSTLVLSFAGTFDASSTCSGAQKAGTLLCTL